MKKWILPLSLIVNVVFTSLLLVTCNKNSSAETSSLKKGTSALATTPQSQTTKIITPLIPGTAFIPKDTANLMIDSYITAINPTQNPDEIHSLLCNADTLLSYYRAHPEIQYFKLSFAHNLTYIHSGQYGVRPAPDDNALTVVISGVDNSGNYVLMDGSVIDYLTPCPDQCVKGSAGNDEIL